MLIASTTSPPLWAAQEGFSTAPAQVSAPQSPPVIYAAVVGLGYQGMSGVLGMLAKTKSIKVDGYDPDEKAGHGPVFQPLKTKLDLTPQQRHGDNQDLPKFFPEFSESERQQLTSLMKGIINSPEYTEYAAEEKHSWETVGNAGKILLKQLKSYPSKFTHIPYKVTSIKYNDSIAKYSLTYNRDGTEFKKEYDILFIASGLVPKTQQPWMQNIKHNDDFAFDLWTDRSKVEKILAHLGNDENALIAVVGSRFPDPPHNWFFTNFDALLRQYYFTGKVYNITPYKSQNDHILNTTYTIEYMPSHYNNIISIKNPEDKMALQIEEIPDKLFHLIYPDAVIANTGTTNKTSIAVNAAKNGIIKEIIFDPPEGVTYSPVRSTTHGTTNFFGNNEAYENNRFPKFWDPVVEWAQRMEVHIPQQQAQHLQTSLDEGIWQLFEK